MRPRWVTSVGVLGIILGSLGILGAIQTYYLPQLIVAQSRMLSQSIDRGARSPVTDAMQQLMTSLADSVTVNAPAWFGTWLACLSVAMDGRLSMRENARDATQGLVGSWRLVSYEDRPASGPAVFP